MARKAPKPTPWRMYAKMTIGGAILCIGGPALTMWLTPTEEELFARYNPELQRRSLENREQKQEEFDNFVRRLKEYSKSDKPIWEAAAEMEAKKKKVADAVRLAEQKQAEQRQTPLRGVVDAIEAARNEEGAEGKVEVKR
ncbi:hypothetical protein VE03_06267 [Pseudogymnoascus sp. 23342-1-I1]|nr:hypothetical protein VE03_06267 [Pseudogymnoascus sp. 23342-1-I1]